MCGERGQGCQARAGWRHCFNSAFGSPWRRTQSFVARWVLRRRVALREDDLLLTACLVAEDSLYGWRGFGASWQGVVRRATVGRAFLGKASAFSPVHRGRVKEPQSLCATNTKCMMPTSQRDRQFKVLLSSASYFLFLNKITWAGSAGGGRTFRVQQLLSILCTI